MACEWRGEVVVDGLELRLLSVLEVVVVKTSSGIPLAEEKTSSEGLGGGGRGGLGYLEEHVLYSRFKMNSKKAQLTKTTA